MRKPARLHRIRRQCTYSNVCATIALIVAVSSGTAYAAVLITGSQIKDGTVTSADVANSSLTGADLRDGAVTSADVGNGQLTGSDLASNTVSGSNIKTGSIAVSDLSSSVIDSLTVAQLVGSQCTRERTVRDTSVEGSLLIKTSAAGSVQMYCQAPPAEADSAEPNDTLATAASAGFRIDDYWADGFTGGTHDLSIFPAGDEDWYTFAVSCPCNQMGVAANGIQISLRDDPRPYDGAVASENAGNLLGQWMDVYRNGTKIADGTRNYFGGTWGEEDGNGTRWFLPDHPLAGTYLIRVYGGSSQYYGLSRSYVPSCTSDSC